MRNGRVKLGMSLTLLATFAGLEGCSATVLMSQSAPATPTVIVTHTYVPTTAVTVTSSPSLWLGLEAGSYWIYSMADLPDGVGTISDSLYALSIAGGDPQLIASQVTNGWLSPDGQEVAYLEIAEGLSRVMILDRSTGSRWQVGAGNGCLSVDWSPDGTEIACSGEKDIFVFGVNDPTPTRITTWSRAGYEDSWALPVWSPTGKQLAYFNLPDFQTSTEDGLYITDLSCQNEPKTCQPSTVGPFGKFSGMPRPAWAPNGRMLVVADFGTLYVLDLLERRLSEIARGSQDHMIDGVAWSPNGDQIAYSENGEIKVISRNGGSPETVAVTEGILLEWIEVH